jgi:ribonuclease P protein component
MTRFRAFFSFTPQEIRSLFRTTTVVIKTAILEIKKRPVALSYGRFLIVVPRRAGSAVERNKLRRRLKTLFYEEKLYDRGFDLLLFAQKGAASLSFETLKELLLKIY